MKNKSVGGSLCLTLAALLWGSTFVAQEVNTVGAFTFQGVRSMVGSLFLLVVIGIMTAMKKSRGTYEKPTKEDNKNLLLGGVCCGLVLCLSMNLQQIGMELGAQAGKAGFITAMYILLVPVYGLFAKKRVSIRIWCCIAISVVGLFLLCINFDELRAGNLAVGVGDIFVMLCAFSFALHIIVVDVFVEKVDGVKLSFMQFVVAGIISCVLMFVFEQPTISGILKGAFPILYAGICSSGIAYTLQIVGQKNTPAVIASLLMSLESVFAVLTQIVIMGRLPSVQESMGCVVMFAAIIIAQLPDKKVNDHG